MARCLSVEASRVPKVSIGMKTRHQLAVSEAMDRLGMDGEVEVPVGNLIADAVCEVDGKHVYLEVDLSRNDLREKARRYKEIAPVRLVIVTHRPESTERAFSGVSRVVVVPYESLHYPGVSEAVKGAI